MLKRKRRDTSLTKKIFALDIGTRSVVGIILEIRNEKYVITDVIIREHTERAMLDGQIHDVVAVSNVILDIKLTLEKKHGPLTKVCVAAAGRALRTEIGRSSIHITGKPLLSADDRIHLELAAVQQAQFQVAENEDVQHNYHYYCVGYSVLHYYLDEQEIGNLLDQKGDVAEAEVIATFLPRVVVESLFAALKRVDLELEALTLEPIAAIHVLIPPSMRRLNVCLVDIGAGTSDIAITDERTIVAYGMVPYAGDEITEEISDYYLLDFPYAEEVKRSINESEKIIVHDILGFESEVAREEMISAIFPAIEKLADSISQEILRLNNAKPPQAVMLIGGGSLTPRLSTILAEKLNLPDNRVAIRGIEAIKNLEIEDDHQQGPELVTPIGIAISSEVNPIHYVSVEVNGTPVRLFDLKQLTIGDALLAAGLQLTKLYGKPGNAKIVSINGRNTTIPGTHGEPPIIKKNNVNCPLDAALNPGDQLWVEKGNDGTETSVILSEFLDELPKRRIYINEEEYEIYSSLFMNGLQADGREEVHDGDQILFKMPDTVEDALMFAGLKSIVDELTPFNLIINGQQESFPPFSGAVYVNEKEAQFNHRISDGDHLTLIRRKPVTVNDLLTIYNTDEENHISVTFNNEPLILTNKSYTIYRNDTLLNNTDILLNGERIHLKYESKSSFIFQDLFRYVEIEFPQDKPGGFHLMRNKQEATFYDEIHDGDQLEIVWFHTHGNPSTISKPVRG